MAKIDRTFSNGTQEARYVESIFGKKVADFGRLRQTRKQCRNSTWYVMTEIPGLKYKMLEFVAVVGLNMA